MTSGTKDKWVKCISTHGNIRGVAVQATGLVRQMATMHSLSGPHAQALGEATMGALLIGSYCKPGERINLNVQGSGLIKQALVDAHPDGTVRGYAISRAVEEIHFKETEKTGPWGTGVLSVLRTKGTEGEQPYIGTVPLVTGHLAKDLTFYWHQSEQVPSAVGLVVNLHGHEISSAAGFLVQAMPGATQDEIRMIERHIQEIQSLAESVAKDADPLSLLSQIFQSTAFVLLEERPLEFKCNCSWERVRRALSLVGPVEMRAMLEQQGAVVRCDFCTKEYRIEAEMLNELIAASEAPVKK